MSVKSSTRQFLRRIGLEINRFNTSQSHAARVGAQLRNNEIDCVLDVGANDGGYGEFIRVAGFKGHIVSFEPQADAHRALVKKCRGDGKWHIAARMALGDAEGELDINIAGNSASSSLLRMLPSHAESAPQSKYVRKERVAVHRLDALDEPIITAATRIYLKIDTQGYEMPVLLGASGIMDKIVGVQLEMSLIPLYEGQSLFQELLAWLDEAGFEMWGVVPGFMNQKTGRMLQLDGIFYRRRL
jgi:FkbM family methyltransferase